MREEPRQERLHFTESLIRAAQAGDPASLRRLYDLCLPVVQSLLKSLRRRHGDEDLVADSLVDLFVALRGFRFESDFFTFIHKIVFRRMRRQDFETTRRRARDEIWTLVFGGRTDDETVAGEAPASAEDRRLLINQALDRLQFKQRMVLILVDREGHTPAEVAEMMGTTRQAVYDRLQRARARMRRQLARHGIEWVRPVAG
jgi:RNA polymerase sigma-70 factor, ECF subfamily